jgi:hypothetical protein
MRIKVEPWSHCAEAWMFYDYFDNREVLNEHISGKGYDPKYFRVVL